MASCPFAAATEFEPNNFESEDVSYFKVPVADMDGSDALAYFPEVRGGGSPIPKRGARWHCSPQNATRQKSCLRSPSFELVFCEFRAKKRAIERKLAEKQPGY